MTSVDEELIEPFKLELNSIQGKWLCEELGASLTVSGNAVQYTSGECYPIEVTSEGKLEIFGYRGLEKKSDASSIVWKNKETGQYLTWIYEGDNQDNEPEVDAALIIGNGEGRTTRKRKVDYVALDKVLDNEEGGKQGAWRSEYEQIRSAGKTGPAEHEIEHSFSKLKGTFNRWIRSTDTDRFRVILTKRGYLSTEIAYSNNPVDREASARLVNFLKSLGAKAAPAQSGSNINVRVPEAIWSRILTYFRSEPVVEEPSANPKTVSQVEQIKNVITAYCDRSDHSEEETKKVVESLGTLEGLHIDLDVLKATKIGVEINRLSKILERAKQTLNHLKNIYLESKKP
jgi:hypothetical protein